MNVPISIHLLIKPLTSSRPAVIDGVASKSGAPATISAVQPGGFAVNQRLLALVAWSAAGAPLAWGLWMTFTKSLVLFR